MKSISSPLNGFEKIIRYYDQKKNKTIVKIKTGDIYITKNKEELITTTLGSCIGVCFYDPISQAYGMLHFILPFNSSDDLHSKAGRYGSWAMEFMINENLKLGGGKNTMQFKVYGGASVIIGAKYIQIPKKNIEFINNYIVREKLCLIDTDLGGSYARTVTLDTATNDISINKISDQAITELSNEESDALSNFKNKPFENDVTIF